MDIDRIKYLRNLGDDNSVVHIKKESFYNRMCDMILNDYKVKNWDGLFLKFDSHQHFPVFLELYQEFDDKWYFTMLGNILSGSTYYNDYSDVIVYLLNHPQRNIKYRKYLMNLEERKFLKSLKANTIYRGCSNKFVEGYSWTLSFEEAKKFANRNYGEVFILEGSFVKSDAIAYFKREDEIFINPKYVSNKRIINSFNRYPDRKVGTHYRRNKNQEIRDIVKKSEPYKRLLREIQDA